MNYAYKVHLFLLIFFSINVSATTLNDLKAHTPTSDKTWAEQWFYNVSIPEVGYFKISFQTYIAATFIEPKPKAYIHLAFAPISGETVTYDLFLDQVILTHPEDPGQFYYEAPGVIVADEEAVTVTHEGFNFTLHWNGPHKRYWKGLNPGQTPFGIIPEIPGVGGKWFLYTVGTPVNYSFHDGTQSLTGTGYAQLDKGWFDKESSTGFAYTMGLTRELYYMFTGAKVGNSALELWAGRYISDAYDLIFYPALNNVSVKREIDPCSGYLRVELNKIHYKLIVEAQAPMETFYPLEFPSVIIFGGEQRYQKSMQASTNFSLYKKGKLVETINMPQALLEFSGPMACDDFFE